MPVVCEFLSTRAVDVLLRMMRQVQLRLNSKLRFTGLLPTMFDSRLRHSRLELEELQRRLAETIPVLTGCVIPRSVRFAEAAAAGKSMLHYSPEHPGAGGVSSLGTLYHGGNELGSQPPPKESPGIEVEPHSEQPRIDVFVRKHTPGRQRG